jgi:hypothetical protein
MIYEYTINNLRLQTGDLICAVDGNAAATDLKGQFWRLLGKLIPGAVDHIIVYVGPEGRCIEAAAKGYVNAFDVQGNIWDYQLMLEARGGVIDTLYGAVYPLRDVQKTAAEIAIIREAVADFCNEQAILKKPYNFNLLRSDTDDAFYCSQLAYRAYLPHGINLNTGIGIPNIPGTKSIIFPQEVWEGCFHERV